MDHDLTELFDYTVQLNAGSNAQVQAGPAGFMAGIAPGTES